MGILPLKKRVNRDKCSFATKQRMFGVFAIDEILRYRGTRFPGSRTLCHPGVKYMTKCLKPFKVDILLQLTRRATLDLLCCNFSQYSARPGSRVTGLYSAETDRWHDD